MTKRPTCAYCIGKGCDTPDACSIKEPPGYDPNQREWEEHVAENGQPPWAAHPQPSPDSAGRAEFEAWAQEHFDCAMGSLGHYADERTEFAWMAWQASRSRPASPAAEPFELAMLRRLVEETVMVAQTDEDADGFVSAYHFKTGAIHRLLAAVRTQNFPPHIRQTCTDDPYTYTKSPAYRPATQEERDAIKAQGEKVAEKVMAEQRRKHAHPAPPAPAGEDARDAARWREVERNPFAAIDRILAAVDPNKPALWAEQARAALEDEAVRGR